MLQNKRDRIVAGLVLGAVGAWLAPAGYAALGWGIGSTIGNLLFPSSSETSQQGPRLSDLKAQSSVYGIPIPVTYGAIRLAGNVIWALDIVETTHTETTTSGGKGGGSSTTTTTTYTYSQSFAVAICEGPIVGIRKIWANGKLIYSLADNADNATISASNEAAVGFIFYQGTETQEPNSLIQADKGISATPAYRGTVYVILTDLQLADFGNRTPNLEFEVVKAGGLSFIFTALPEVSTLAGVNSYYFWGYNVGKQYSSVGSKDGTLLYVITATGIEVWDTSGNGTPQYLRSFTVSPAPLYLALNENSTRLFCANYSVFSVFNADAQGNLTEQNTVPVSISSELLTTFDGDNMYAQIGGYLTKWAGILGGALIETIINTDNPQHADGALCNAGSYLYRVQYSLGLQVFAKSDLSLLFTDIANQGTQGCSIIVSPSGQYLFTGSQNGGNGGFIRVWSLANPAAPSYITTVTHGGGNPYFLQIRGNYLYIAGKTAGIGRYLTVIDISNPASPVVVTSQSADSGGSSMSDVSSISLHGNYVTIGRTENNSGPPVMIDSVFFANNVMSKNTVPLSSIVSDICLRAGVGPASIDVTSLTDQVDGYVVRQGTARSWIEPLMQAFYFDVVESGGKIKFVKRGQSSLLTIVEDDLAAAKSSRSLDPLKKTRKQEVELPSSFEIKYMDTVSAYLPGTQMSQRSATSSKNVVSLSLTIAMSANKAKQVADVLLYEAWIARTTAEFSVGWKYAHLDAADVVSVVRSNITHIVRITETDFAGGVVSIASATEDPSVYSQVSVGASQPASSEVVLSRPNTTLKLLDIPLLRDQDDGYGFYVAAAGVAPGWKGAQVFKSVDDGATWGAIENPITVEATIGVARSVLPQFNNHDVFDESNSVTVLLGKGSLASVTRDQVLSGANAALIGDEIIQFRSASNPSPMLYVLTGLLRGLRGTEWAESSHAVGERFILLDPAKLSIFAGLASEYGVLRRYRGVTFGKFLQDVGDTPFTHTAVERVPYSPVGLGGGRNAALDLTIKWVRRSRIAGTWNNYADTPLGETSELYVVKIFADGTYTTIKRTISGITIQTTTYTAANQVTDFGSAQATIYWSVCQVSSTIGNGREAKGIT